MLDLTQAQLKKVIIHKVGNKLLEDGITLSSHGLEIDKQPDLKLILERFFTFPFKEPVFYNLHHVSSLELNEIYSLSKALFESGRSFVKKSQDIARILYEYSNHPKIKAGELYVVYFEECNVNNEFTEAIGIFKSENKENFLTISEEDKGYLADFREGISLKKPEKGCLIFNTDQDEGYRVVMIDNQGSGQDAQYWKDEFLKLKPVADNFFQTRNYLDLARSFVTERLDEEFEVTKADQIDYLNRSLDYFKKKEQFNEHEFASEVFEHQSVIKSFKKFKNDFQDQNDLQIVSEFDISTPAVKKQSRVFKSVLKLDRNFHIYIHGDKDLIERGIDEDGRKYYKIYYQQES